MQTPLTNVLLCSEFKDVYPPSEDSFLFLDALEADIHFLKSVKPCVTLEVGSGSGIISTFLCNANLGVCFHICTDVCPAACIATKRVLEANLIPAILPVDSVRCSLTTPLTDRLASSVDIVLFNPPYVPTAAEEHSASGSTIASTWSGGLKGREVIDAFLVQAVKLLSPRGCIYLLLSDDNCPSEVHRLVHALSSGRLLPSVILRRRAQNESLGIYRYSATCLKGRCVL
ncbi:hypothetical protein CRM22_007482 [Opisthorchis felineus]|uniref:Methyltransferase HEMK2 n=1 Tax=Opisthorchis felineus TaxID=147828 RepID=A0A4S2LNY6_OPIFE|nr:hypothetical protein CRM22_007482 [Opisthorchis felineus]